MLIVEPVDELPVQHIQNCTMEVNMDDNEDKTLKLVIL